MAAFHSVVEQEQMPPPSAPCGNVWPCLMTPPCPMPGRSVRLPTVFHKLNLSPAGTTVPLIFKAGSTMLAPKKLRSLRMNPVVHDEISCTFGARAIAWAVVNAGSTSLIVIATADVDGPAARRTRAL